ncbi:ATP-binding protein [Chitinimonas koreensis]|uniref:ATP-binding protein n=1 Tax=Chitinimonas koreensis TaxID=356302 RepID=UPI0004082819|nr:ATP-binding protein [Chitinimonas koreensis]QNM94741.1 two-component sensor histidine kinase [Chitinimonas koreensis]
MSAPAGSLRRRLILLLLGVLAPVWLALAGATYWFMLHEVDELFDHQLEQVAATLLALDTSKVHEAVDAPGLNAFDDDDAFAAWIWSSDGRLLFHSEIAPPLRFEAQPARLQTVEARGERWRLLRVQEPGSGRWLGVARPWHERDELAAGLAAGLLGPWLLSLLLMVGLLWLAVGGGLAPLKELSRQIAGRRHDDLSAVAVAAAPREVEPLVQEINLLLRRVEVALDNERRFTADASHELRTPLAAIRAQVEVAAAEPDDEARRHALRQAVRGLDRAQRLTGQLLTLARLDHLEAVPEAGACGLLGLAREVLADAAAQALAHGVELALDGEELVLHAAPGLLRLALRNLVDNAVAHTPAGGTVTVRLAREDGGAMLTVQDEGGGVTDAVLERLGERFYRGESARPGSGLGLSIVRRVAALHGGRLAFSRESGGLCAALWLPVR